MIVQRRPPIGVARRARADHLRNPAAVLPAAAAAMTAGVLVPVPPIRAAVVLPLALLAPGYALAAAAGIRGRLDAVPTLALGALLSIAIYPLLALGLYATSIRLSTTSVVAATDAVVLLLSGVVALRTRFARDAGTAGGGPAAVATDTSPASSWSGRRGGVRFVVAVAVAVAVLAGAMRLLPAAADAPYTQLYLAGHWSGLGAIVDAEPHQRLAVRVAIVNRTHARKAYRLAPTVDGGVHWPARVVTLQAGDRWVGFVTGRIPRRRCVHRLTLELSSRESSAVLTDLNVWVRTERGASRTCAT